MCIGLYTNMCACIHDTYITQHTCIMYIVHVLIYTYNTCISCGNVVGSIKIFQSVTWRGWGWEGWGGRSAWGGGSAMCDSLCWRRGRNGQKYRDILYGQNLIHQFLVETRVSYRSCYFYCSHLLTSNFLISLSSVKNCQTLLMPTLEPIPVRPSTIEPNNKTILRRAHRVFPLDPMNEYRILFSVH